MSLARERGTRVYEFYRALTYAFTPLVRLHFRWRRFRGLEHQTRWPERFGFPSLPRPPGRLIWFHAVSLGEGMAALPLIKRCICERSDLNVLMTTTSTSAFEIMKNQLPRQAVYQFAPLDLPTAIDAFLGYWKPDAIVLMESELWPNLVMSASRGGIMLALVNARISSKSLKRWSISVVYPLISLMLSKFALIIPLSKVEAEHFQLLQAPPLVIEECHTTSTIAESLKYLLIQLDHRRVWMASSIHKGEEEVMLGAHNVLVQSHPDTVTILVPRQPQHGREIAVALRKQGLNVALRSADDKLFPGTNVYVVDTLGELRYFYKLAPIAVVGGSFLPGLKGHNVSEAAAAGCAVLTGPHIAHFSHMVLSMQKLNPLSIVQVNDRMELEKTLMQLFSDTDALEARRLAARQTFEALSREVVSHVWKMLFENVIQKALNLR
ncbi:hypothetical protein V2J09_017454 [Rumex salicifolius]